MTLANTLPTLDLASLGNLRDNATRLLAGPPGARHDQAVVLLPLIEAEFAARAAAKPTKAKATKVAKVKKVVETA